MNLSPQMAQLPSHSSLQHSHCLLTASPKVNSELEGCPPRLLPSAPHLSQMVPRAGRAIRGAPHHLSAMAPLEEPVISHFLGWRLPEGAPSVSGVSLVQFSSAPHLSQMVPRAGHPCCSSPSLRWPSRGARILYFLGWRLSEGASSVSDGLGAWQGSTICLRWSLVWAIRVAPRHLSEMAPLEEPALLFFFLAKRAPSVSDGSLRGPSMCLLAIFLRWPSCEKAALYFFLDSAFFRGRPICLGRRLGSRQVRPICFRLLLVRAIHVAPRPSL